MLLLALLVPQGVRGAPLDVTMSTRLRSSSTTTTTTAQLPFCVGVNDAGCQAWNDLLAQIEGSTSTEWDCHASDPCSSFCQKVCDVPIPAEASSVRAAPLTVAGTCCAADGLGSFKIIRIIVPAAATWGPGGTLPSTVLALTSLQYLDLSGHNGLVGTLPPFLGTSTSLEVLDLGGTQISGSLPPSFNSLVHLVTLDLNGTEISGPLPPSFPYGNFAPPLCTYGIGKCCQLQHLQVCPLPPLARTNCAIHHVCPTAAPTLSPTTATPVPSNAPSHAPTTAAPPVPASNGPAAAPPSAGAMSRAGMFVLVLCLGCCLGVTLLLAALGVCSVAVQLYQMRRGSVEYGNDDMESYRKLPGDLNVNCSSTTTTSTSSSSSASTWVAAWYQRVIDLDQSRGHAAIRVPGRTFSFVPSATGPPSPLQMFLWWVATPLHIAVRLCCCSNSCGDSSSEGRTNATSLAVLSASTTMTASDLLIDPMLVVIGPKLAAGGFGAVYRGKMAGTAVVLKEVYTQILDGDDEGFLREARMLHSLRHPHIITFFGISWREDAPSPEGWGGDGGISESLGKGESHDELGALDVSDLGASGASAVSVGGSRGHRRFESTGLGGHFLTPAHSRSASNSSGSVASGRMRRRSRLHSRVRSQADLAWGLLIDAAEEDRARLLIVTEFCPGGTLADAIQKRAYDRDANFKRHALQLAETLQWLHTKSPPIIHRDIKPANLLLDANGDLKLCDLGLARSQAPMDGDGVPDVEMTGGMGSAAYVPPEVMNPSTDSSDSDEIRLRYDGRAWDIFSFAMVCCQLWQQRPLYPRMSRFQIVSGVSQGLRPVLDATMPPRLTRLLTAMWSTNPIDRPSAKQVVKALRHPHLLRPKRRSLAVTEQAHAAHIAPPKRRSLDALNQPLREEGRVHARSATTLT